MSDWDLVEQYVGGDARALERLVRTHIQLVFRTACRAVGPADAEDVTQAVFMLLVQKAGRITMHGSLAGWLYRATQFCCANLRKTKRRRQRLEREAAAMIRPQEMAENEGMPQLLDRALQQLGKKERDAVLLRYLQERTFAETGLALGISEDAARMRAQRGIEKMRAFFIRREHGETTLGITAMMAIEAKAVVSAALAQTVTGIAGGTIAAGPAIGSLVKGTAHAMRLARAKALGTVTAVAIVMLGLTGWLIGPSMRENRPPAPTVALAQIMSVPASQPASLPNVSPAIVAKIDGLGAAEIVRLALATRDRYWSIETQVRTSLYQRPTPGPADEPTQIYDVRFGMIGHQSYQHVTYIQSPTRPDVAQTVSIDRFTGPEWIREVRISSGIPMPMETIRRPDGRDSGADSSVLDAVWGNFGWGWERVSAGSVALTKDAKTGWIRLEPPPKSGEPRVAVSVDPAKGYVPTRFQLMRPDGTLVVTLENDDFRDVGQGLWLPFRCTMRNYVSPSATVRELRQVKVNQPIAPEAFDIILPEEADIQNDSEKRRYMTGPRSDPRMFGGRVPGSGKHPSEVTILPAPAQPTATKPAMEALLASRPAQPLPPGSLVAEPSQVYLQQANDRSQAFQVVEISRLKVAQVGPLTITPSDASVRVTEIDPGYGDKIRLQISASLGKEVTGITGIVTIQGKDNGDVLQLPVFTKLLPAIEVLPQTLRISDGVPLKLRVSGWATEKDTPVLEACTVENGLFTVAEARMIATSREVEITIKVPSDQKEAAMGQMTLRFNTSAGKRAIPVDLIWVPPTNP